MINCWNNCFTYLINYKEFHVVQLVDSNVVTRWFTTAIESKFLYGIVN